MDGEFLLKAPKKNPDTKKTRNGVRGEGSVGASPPPRQMSSAGPSRRRTAASRTCTTATSRPTAPPHRSESGTGRWAAADFLASSPVWALLKRWATQGIHPLHMGGGGSGESSLQAASICFGNWQENKGIKGAGVVTQLPPALSAIGEYGRTDRFHICLLTTRYSGGGGGIPWG